MPVLKLIATVIAMMAFTLRQLLLQGTTPNRRKPSTFKAL